jgi:hypothetical protein
MMCQTVSLRVALTRDMRQRVLLRTIYLRIVFFGLHSYCPNRRLPLSAVYKADKIHWCQERQSWRDKWEHIIFNGKSRFCLWRNDGKSRVRTCRGKRKNLDFTIQFSRWDLRYEEVSYMVWSRKFVIKSAFEMKSYVFFNGDS